MDIKSNLPNHIAFIMDGNGRWAKSHHLPRVAGHKKGAETLKKMVEALAKLAVPHVTFFGLSTENWTRPQNELNELIGLLRHYLNHELDYFHQQGARLSIIGDRSRFDADLIKAMDAAEQLTRNNQKIHVMIALNYGGRADLVQAAKRLCTQVKSETLEPEMIDEAMFARMLWTAELPDPDLLIRTSGEMRISNFLLWQLAYSEFVFSDRYWPEFNDQDLAQALAQYKARERRFGGIGDIPE